ncbi:unnamed protein product [Nippostrongylus brasiliensis]|uniref:Ammonium_transp domain-containing protein n=1 Tax=Nippostrongylus brasiliensis TaxID=27835 RepID=A0A0N4Y7J5_NIPBR|nr:unnamed protein product [Nippostrongylus brasiliensis]
MTKLLEHQLVYFTIHIVFIASHLITASSNIHLAGGTALYKALMNYSTPEALLSMNTYMAALHLGLKNCGVALWGVLAAASLHTNRRGSYEVILLTLIDWQKRPIVLLHQPARKEEQECGRFSSPLFLQWQQKRAIEISHDDDHFFWWNLGCFSWSKAQNSSLCCSEQLLGGAYAVKQ